MTTKNTTLEVLKLFASFMVIFIHVPFEKNIGVTVEALARFAVPLFFLISGFFSYQITPQKISKRIKHILSLLIFAVLSYTLFNIATSFLNGGINGVILYFGQYLNIRNLVKIFIFNVPISAGHLWYLLAILYVYAIFYLTTLLHINEKIIFSVSFMLLFLNILLDECFSILGIVLLDSITRNFVFTGIPFFAIGLLVKKYEQKIKNYPPEKNYILIITSIIGIFESIVSRYLFGRNVLYIGSVLILFAFVVIFVKYSDVKFPRFFDSLTDLSTYIYIFHIMISPIIIKMYSLLNINFNNCDTIKNIHPLIVCAASSVLSFFIIRTVNFFKNQKHKTAE